VLFIPSNLAYGELVVLPPNTTLMEMLEKPTGQKNKKPSKVTL
jgi:hypothetical protein